MVTKWVPVVCMLAAAWGASAADITVRYYNMAGLPEKAMRDAIETASRAFESGRVPLRWLHCTNGGNDCSGTGGRAFELRILEDVQAVESGAAAMGIAMLVPAGGSTHAKVLLHRVTKYAKRLDLPVSRVLGYAIAHEVGHLLMERGQHSHFGIMQACWPRGEAAMIAGGRLQFHSSDIRQMRMQFGVR